MRVANHKQIVAHPLRMPSEGVAKLDGDVRVHERPTGDCQSVIRLPFGSATDGRDIGDNYGRSIDLGEDSGRKIGASRHALPIRVQVQRPAVRPVRWFVHIATCLQILYCAKNSLPDEVPPYLPRCVGLPGPEDLHRSLDCTMGPTRREARW